MKKRLKAIIEDNTTKRGRAFEYFIQVLIIISMISFAVETLPDLSDSTSKILYWIEVFCVIVFSVEYILRIYVATNPVKYLFSFYGIIDLLAILPFYLQTSVDLRSLRAFRILRIFRALKLIRYSKAMNRFRVAFNIVREELVLFFIVATIFLFLAASGIYLFENEAQPEKFSSIFQSLWWAMVTLTTVGYGDVYPITIGGRIFTFFILIIGVGIITVPAGILASALSKARGMEI